ncbi:MAG: globin [Oceanospirillaceae bacterium]|nr:globin [Oceanospirillaceae bacterium]MBT13545.1 globin [Oceanospirillaceae bacterium]|tara:strand:+ start:79637 stop:80044 length:408 start_codon:yes stop_codon:yes gene_type:complete
MTVSRHRYGEYDTSYLAAGGMDGLRHLTEQFYQFLDTLPEAAGVRAMYPEDTTESAERLACFLSGWLGGPALYREKYGEIVIPSFHRQWTIDASARDAWLQCMQLAVDQQSYAPAFKQYLMEQLSVPAERCRNSR